MLQDFRYACRVLVKNPGFAIAAIVTLALGIGANAAIFSLVYGVLLRPLPYQNGGRLVVLHQKATRLDGNFPFSVKEIEDYRHLSHTIDSVVEHHSMSFILLTDEGAERVNSAIVSANFFDVLGVKPLLGRTFVATDEEHGANAVLILSYEYWKARHGGDPKIIGRVFRMNNLPHTVIGVLPPIPQYPVTNDVYMPTSQCPFRSSAGFIANRTSRMMTAFARLKPGVSVEQAQADLSTVAKQMEQANPDAYPSNVGYAMAVAGLQEDLTRRARTTFLVLLGAAGLVLLIACANVANLLLARLLKVEREFAIRAALGANRMRLVRQLLTESVLLAAMGGALGIALAPGALAMLVKFAERFTTRAAEVRLDAPVLVFTLALSILTGILFGLAPAFFTGRTASEALKQGARNTSGPKRQTLRGALVVAQVAVSFTLLIGAGLMIRSFLKLESQSGGVVVEHALAMRLSTSSYTMAQLIPFSDQVLQRVREVTGVESAAFASNFPFNPGGILAGPNIVLIQIEGQLASKSEGPRVASNGVSPEYFETVGQRIVDGRTFTDHDDEKSELVVIINESTARHYWPGRSAVGRRVSPDEGKTWLRIVGVAADAKEYGLDKPVHDEAYVPIRQDGFSNNLVVRTTGDPVAVVAAVRAAIREIDPQVAIDRVNSIERFRYDSMAAPRVTTILLGLFAGLAVLISAFGIAAVMALAVTQRTNELGIRMALGASRASILSMVVRQGLMLTVLGTALGFAGALGLTRMLASLLYATSPTDTATFASVAALFLLIAGVASFIPARQATAIDPLDALRRE